MKTIEVVVARDGAIKVAAKGYRGPDCEKATRALEQELGDRGESKRTVEFYTMPESPLVARR